MSSLPWFSTSPLLPFSIFLQRIPFPLFQVFHFSSTELFYFTSVRLSGNGLWSYTPQINCWLPAQNVLNINHVQCPPSDIWKPKTAAVHKKHDQSIPVAGHSSALLCWPYFCLTPPARASFSVRLSGTVWSCCCNRVFCSAANSAASGRAAAAALYSAVQ